MSRHPDLPAGPRPWRVLLALASPPRDRIAILDDLNEEYRERLERTPILARSWYRRQVLTSLPCLLARRLQLVGRRLTLHPPGEPTMSNLLNDLRGGWRELRRAPLLSALVILVLALGIGANTAIFSLLNPILLRPLPYADAERLVHMFETDPSFGSLGWDMLRQSLPTLDAWAKAESFEEVAGYYYGETALRAQGRQARAVTTGFITGNLFSMLGVEPLIGRNFLPTEDASGRNHVLLLSHALWQSQFGGDEAILGRQALVDGEPHVVVGVMEPDFNFPYGEVRMWKPAAFDPQRWGPDVDGILTLGRLRPGVSFATARAELAAIRAGLAEQYPDAYANRGVRVVRLRRALVFFHDLLQAMMLTLLFASGFVLLIVCANVANLLLSRAGKRQREVAIRGALGAGRGRIVRQLLTENALLAVVGGTAGILVARAASGAVSTVIPAQLYRVGEIEIDAAAVAFTGLATLITAVAFGLAPALRSARVAITDTLKETHAAASGASKRRLARALVFAQVAIATLLCGGAVLAVAAAHEYGSVDLGFDPGRVLTVGLTLPRGDYPTGEEIRGFYRRAADAARRLPGTESIGWISDLPLDFSSNATAYRLPGDPADDTTPKRRAASAVTAPGYFASMGIPLMSGRDFGDQDGPDDLRVVIVNELLASHLWPQTAAIGETLMADFGAGEVETTVVGVAGNSVGGFALNGIEEQLYAPVSQRTFRRGFLTVRSALDAAEVTPSIRSALAEIDPNLPVDNVRTMGEIAAQSAEPVVAVRNLLSGLGVFAVFLASLGVYGVAAHAIAERTHEIGVRVAMGAGPADIVRVVMRSAIVTVLLAALLGAAGTVGLQGALALAVDDPSAISPLSAVAVGALLATVAIFASWIPARKATRVDPMEALRAATH